MSYQTRENCPGITHKDYCFICLLKLFVQKVHKQGGYFGESSIPFWANVCYNKDAKKIRTDPKSKSKTASQPMSTGSDATGS